MGLLKPLYLVKRIFYRRKKSPLKFFGEKHGLFLPSSTLAYDSADSDFYTLYILNVAVSSHNKAYAEWNL